MRHVARRCRPALACSCEGPTHRWTSDVERALLLTMTSSIRGVFTVAYCAVLSLPRSGLARAFRSKLHGQRSILNSRGHCWRVVWVREALRRGCTERDVKHRRCGSQRRHGSPQGCSGINTNSNRGRRRHSQRRIHWPGQHGGRAQMVGGGDTVRWRDPFSGRGGIPLSQLARLPRQRLHPGPGLLPALGGVHRRRRRLLVALRRDGVLLSNRLRTAPAQHRRRETRRG